MMGLAFFGELSYFEKIVTVAIVVHLLGKEVVPS